MFLKNIFCVWDFLLKSWHFKAQHLSIRHHSATPCLSSSTKTIISPFLFFSFHFFEESIACNAAILSALNSYWNVTFWYLVLSTSYYLTKYSLLVLFRMLDVSLNYSAELATTFCNVVFSWVLCQDSWHTPCFNGFCILGPGVLLLNNISFIRKMK